MQMRGNDFMLNGVSLSNFKVFKSLENLEIKPLTIICGVNSSGKSSILKSLLLMKQSFENSQATNACTLNGAYTQNGSGRDVIHKGQGDTFSISVQSRLSHTPFIKGSSQPVDRGDVTTYKELSKIFDLPNNEDIDLSLSIDFTASCIISRMVLIVSSATMKSASVTLTKCSNDKNSQYDIELCNFPTYSGERLDTTLVKCSCYFEGMKLVNVFAKVRGVQYDTVLPYIYTLMRHASKLFNGVKHLSPVRELSARRYIADNDYISVGASSEYIAQVLYATNKDIKTV